MRTGCALDVAPPKKGELKMSKNKIRLIAILASTATVLTAVVSIWALGGAKQAMNNKSDEESTTKADGTGTYIPPVYDNAGNEDVEPEPDENETEAPSPIPEEKSLEFVSNGNGTCTVVGIGSIPDTCIIIPEKSPSGEVVTGIGEKAFYGNSKINAVQIPSTVTHIGSMAFGGCGSLAYISVSADNNSFCDVGGILFSRDGKTLMHYPALKGNETLNISFDLKEISPMAFYDCPALKYINYDGEVTDWASIIIGEGNYALYSISIRCKAAK